MEIEIEKLFCFLENEYHLDYKFQRFENCFGGHWTVDTYSYFNKTGCFTIQALWQRGEIDFYYSSKISNVRKDLQQKLLDITSIGKETWKKASKKLFFWYRPHLYLKTLSLVIKNEIEQRGEFFGIKVKNND